VVRTILAQDQRFEELIRELSHCSDLLAGLQALVAMAQGRLIVTAAGVALSLPPVAGD
jgi:hypothetical protein